MPALPTLTHRQLGLFRAVMLHGSVSRAAEVSNTSQPTLSRELARLEQLLGFALFDRIRGRLRPTVRGLALMQEVERSFVSLEHIAVRAQELRLQATGRLRLACLPALAHSLAPAVLRQLEALQPGVQVAVHPIESPWLEQAMGEQRFDAALCETLQSPVGTQLRELLRVNEIAVLPAHHSLCRKKTLKPQDFAGQRFISLAPGDPYRAAIDQMFEAAQVQRVMALETSSAVAVCAMVRQGLGVAIVNPLTALELSGPELVLRPLSVAIAFRVSLILPQVSAPHPLQAVLVQAIDAAVNAYQLSAPYPS